MYKATTQYSRSDFQCLSLNEDRETRVLDYFYCETIESIV